MAIHSEIIIKFSDFMRFEGNQVAVKIADNVTTFVGPNGSGKSSLLESAALVFGFFSTTVQNSFFWDSTFSQSSP